MENDYVTLSDIFPTGWHATELAGVKPGDSVAVYSGGPVGLIAAYSANLKGAGKVMLVDRQPDRLELAESIRVIPIDDSDGSPVDRSLGETGGEGADCGCEAVGYQAHDHHGDKVAFDFGSFWFKGQRMATGQANGQAVVPDQPRTSARLSRPPAPARLRGDGSAALRAQRRTRN